jgi:hypothetical protein
MSDVMIDVLRVLYTLHNKVGLTAGQLGDLCESLDKTPRQIQEILKSASDKWEGLIAQLDVGTVRAPAAPATATGPESLDLREALLRAEAAAVRLSKEQITKVRRKVAAFPQGGSLPLDVCRALVMLRDGAGDLNKIRDAGLERAVRTLGGKGVGTPKRYPGRLFHWLMQGREWPTFVNAAELAKIRELASTEAQRERYKLLEASCYGTAHQRGLSNKVLHMERKIGDWLNPRAYVLG